ncbi:MAG TPA: hypothetical protein VGR20_14120 [Acidimicrobiia bacterium]|jgi:hypothetical protein|nr:hypothetical protein [Acidimicrobiia bacterium]
MQHIRRLRIPLLITLAVLVAAFGSVGTRPRTAGASLREEGESMGGTGVGMYTDDSVAHQVSSFTINPKMVSCGVGTLAAGGDASGPFAMLMYSTRIDTYTVDKESGEIRATGRMRSITKAGGAVVEDAEHDFLAIAASTVHHGGFEDAVHSGGDRFDVHFSTPFWDRYNPMCSPSVVAAGKCRFGGELLLGHVFMPH